MIEGESGATTGTVAKVSAAASLGIAAQLDGPRRAAVLLGTATHTAWFDVGSDVVVVGDTDAVRQANSVIIAGSAAAGVLDAVDLPAVVGEGGMAIGPHLIGIARWWDPHPALSTTAPDIVRLFLSAAAAIVPPVEAEALRAGLTAGDAPATAAAAADFIGRGTGLTPAGDDLVTGAFGAYGIIGEALGLTTPAAVLEATAPALETPLAGTSTFSAALVRHAIAGRVAAPVALALRALVGRTPLDDAFEALLAVGHTSGRALAQGVLIGARAACGGAA